MFRSADNPNDVLILWKWDSVEQARAFAETPDLRETMQKAGVTGRPDLYFLEEIEEVPV
jgi:heme-degrading monooxygenase HmoA